MISKELVQCAEDMRQVAQRGQMTLDAQTRAYDLLEKIEELRDSLAALCSSMGPAEEFCGEYLCLAEVLSPAYDEEALKLHCKVPVMGQIPQWVVGEDKGSIDMKHANAADIERNYVNRLLTNKTPFSVKESFKTLRTNLTYVAVNDVTRIEKLGNQVDCHRHS